MSPVTMERRVVTAVGYRPRPYWSGALSWSLFFISPVVPAWAIGLVFDELGANGATNRFWWLLGFFAVVNTVFTAAMVVFHPWFVRGFEAAKCLMRVNVVSAQVASGGRRAGRRGLPVGDTLARLRDDPQDTAFLLDHWLDLLGSGTYALIAVLLLARIDVWATIAAVTPILATAWLNQRVAVIARRFRVRSRAEASRVGEFLAAVLAAALTVRVTGARDQVLDRLDVHNGRRARAAVGESVWNDAQWTFNGALADVFIGVGLAVAARGRLGAGEVAEFAALLGGLVWMPMRIGHLAAGRRRSAVSIDRLDALVAGRTEPGSQGREGDPLVGHRPLPIEGGPLVPPPVAPPRIALERLDIEGLAVPSRRLGPISFTLTPGTMTVITGAVGTGKTTLLRSLLGLIAAEGTVRWNGEVVRDRAAFFVPPQAAYVAQAPQLFAQSLADNLRLGFDLPDEELTEAVRLAAFEQDLATLTAGFDTRIGARGVRLSGGQIQRAATARALARRPELLVVDDLSSALDVETEQQIWARLSERGFTILVASNRPVVIGLADQVIELGPVARLGTDNRLGTTVRRCD